MGSLLSLSLRFSPFPVRQWDLLATVLRAPGIKCRVNFRIFRMRLDEAHACAAMPGEPDTSEASREIRYYNLATGHKYYRGDASITL